MIIIFGIIIIEVQTLCVDSLTSLDKKPQSDVELSKRLASLGIMGAQLRAPLKPLGHQTSMVLRGLWGPLIGPKMSVSRTAFLALPP